MPLLDSLIAPISRIIDKVIPDPEARDRAKLELLRLEHSQETDLLQARLSAIVAEASSGDPWTSRARPSFLYVMYAIILWALPMGVIGAFSPDIASAIASGMTACQPARKTDPLSASKIDPTYEGSGGYPGSP